MKVTTQLALVVLAAVAALVRPLLPDLQIKDLHHQDLAVLAVKVQSLSAAMKVKVMLTAAPHLKPT